MSLMLTSLDTKNILKKLLYPHHCKWSATSYTTNREVSKTSQEGSFTFSIIICWRIYNCSTSTCLEEKNSFFGLCLSPFARIHLLSMCICQDWSKFCTSALGYTTTGSRKSEKLRCINHCQVENCLILLVKRKHKRGRMN